MVSDVTISSALGQSANTQASSTGLAGDFSQFLQLLTVQLQNQDPLSPMETNEFTNQLVAFTGVEQQINANQKLDNLVALGIGSAFSAAQNYVGQDVNYISSEFSYEGASSELRYSLTDNAAISKISILDEAGEVVYNVDAAKSAGAHTFVWDGTLSAGGKAPPGTYQVRVDAIDANENPVEATTIVSGRVRGAETQNGQVFLLVGERAVAISSILNTSVRNDGLGNGNDALTMALSYVGLDVNYKNSELYYDGSNDTDVAYNLPSDADRAKVLIRDELGNAIYTANVATANGANTFTWNGIKNDGTQATAGEYSFEIDAIDSNDKRIISTSLGSGNVTGVETQGGQIFLNVSTASSNSSVNINDILSANVPPA